MKKGQIVENILIEKLVFWGKWFARLEDGKVCFITGWAVPQAQVDIKILKKRKDFYEAQITKVIKKSPLETWKYQEFPGAPWINIEYSEQLKIKQFQVEEALFHCRKYQKNIHFLPIIGMENILWYRNKIEFSFGKYISHREEIFQEFNIWFHKRGDFSRVLDFEDCPLIDEEQNQIYAKVREYTKNSWLPVYDQKINTWFWRHFMMRKMHFSWEILLVFSVNPDFFESTWEKEGTLEKLREFIISLVSQFSSIKSVYISHNRNKADILIGDMELVHGNEAIEEELLWYHFDIGAKSFFQTNSVWAEVLYSQVKDFFSSYQGEKKCEQY